ncbi:MAG: glycosyltransferase family 2 protein [Candidatus Parcubacteria bacterium]|nr:glycosyltransferase family 2 protein [Candidatus Parcubacteria bacterium]
MEKLISYLIPVYNEEKNIPLLYDNLKKTVSGLDFDHEIIFVNDGSQDNSNQELTNISRQDEKIKIIEFSRNFGKEIALTAGLHHCHGDACILLDADLQHPPELIPQFLDKWQNGAEIVIGIRDNNNQKTFIKKTGSYFFYKIINKISETQIIPDSTDYRLLDRVVISEFCRFTERNRIFRGLIDWLGFKRDYIYFSPPERINSKPSYSLLKLIKLALSSFISLSLMPLKIAGYLGILITLIAGMIGSFILAEKYILNDPWQMNFSGSAILAVITLFLVGIILSCLGLIALYIAHIHCEVINRPIYVIRRKENF